MLAARRPTLQEVATIIVGVAEALAHMHSHGVYHGDVRPFSILLSEDLAPVLLLPEPTAVRVGAAGRFALRQHAGARIDEAAFQEHLRTTVNELTGSVARERPERVRAVVNALFDVSLDLFTAGLLGPKKKHPHVSTAWSVLLPCAARLLAHEPTRVAGSVSNGVDHLAAQASARPAEWIDGMRKLAPHCGSVPQWLDAGKVLAWRAGLVQYRSAALRLAHRYIEGLARLPELTGLLFAHPPSRPLSRRL